MKIQSAQSILTVRNDDRMCTQFGPVRLEIMTGSITPMTGTITLVTHTFLWWHHRMILICVIIWTGRRRYTPNNIDIITAIIILTKWSHRNNQIIDPWKNSSWILLCWILSGVGLLSLSISTLFFLIICIPSIISAWFAFISLEISTMYMVYDIILL